MTPLQALLVSMYIDLLWEGVALDISDDRLAECWEELKWFMERMEE
jgi:hypothetical protein